MRFVFLNPHARERDKVRLLIVDVPFRGLVLRPVTSWRMLRRLARQMEAQVPGERIVSDLMRSPVIRVDRAEMDGRRY